MASKRIGTIRLNPGQGGFFDELTRIHLTPGNPVVDIYSDMNLANIRRAIKSRRVSLVNGTLGPDPTPFKLVPENGKYKLQFQSKPTAEKTLTGVEAVQALKTIKEMSADPQSETEKFSVTSEPATISSVSDTSEVSGDLIVEEVKPTRNKKKKNKKSEADF